MRPTGETCLLPKWDTLPTSDAADERNVLAAEVGYPADERPP